MYGQTQKRTKSLLFFCLARLFFMVICEYRSSDSPRFRDIAWPLECDGWALDSWRAFDQWAPRQWQQDTCFPSKRCGPDSSSVDVQLSALINPVLYWSIVFYPTIGFMSTKKTRNWFVNTNCTVLSFTGTVHLCAMGNKQILVNILIVMKNTIGDQKKFRLGLITSLTSLDTKVTSKTASMHNPVHADQFTLITNHIQF